MRLTRHRLARRGLLPVALSVAALAAACVPLPPPPPPPPVFYPPSVAVPPGSPNLSVDTSFATGLAKPWDLAFEPAGNQRLVVTENDTGTIRARIGSTWRDLGSIGALMVSPSPAFDNTGEGGLMGLAFDPNYPTDLHLYVCTSTTVDNRVVRLDVGLDGSGDPLAVSNPVAIVTGIPHLGYHNGCRVRFQPGATPAALFVTTGDAAVGPGPQSDASLAGKVLRIQTNGTAYGNVSGARWFTKGHRNVQGIAFQPVSNIPYSAEHGPNINDEVNRLVDGGNAGWDPTNGTDYDQSKPMTDFVKFPGALVPVFRSGDVRTIAPSGLTFLSGTQWGSWNGAIVLAVLKDSELRVLLMNPDGTASGQFQMPGSARGVRLRSAVQGPDGFLYVATDDLAPSGAIWRIIPS